MFSRKKNWYFFPILSYLFLPLLGFPFLYSRIWRFQHQRTYTSILRERLVQYQSALLASKKLGRSLLAASTSSGDATATTTPLSLTASMTSPNFLKSSSLWRIRRMLNSSFIQLIWSKKLLSDNRFILQIWLLFCTHTIWIFLCIVCWSSLRVVLHCWSMLFLYLLIFY